MVSSIVMTTRKMYLFTRLPSSKIILKSFFVVLAMEKLWSLMLLKVTRVFQKQPMSQDLKVRLSKGASMLLIDALGIQDQDTERKRRKKKGPAKKVKPPTLIKNNDLLVLDATTIVDQEVTAAPDVHHQHRVKRA